MKRTTSALFRAKASVEARSYRTTMWAMYPTMTKVVPIVEKDNFKELFKERGFRRAKA